MAERTFCKEVWKIALPVALQSMLQSSFSMVDQIMVGQLGETSVAAIEIAGKPGFIHTFVAGAIGTVAGIMIAQYIGKGEKEAENRSICVNMLVMLLVSAAFSLISFAFSMPLLRLFTGDGSVLQEGNGYLRIICWTFLPMGISNILGVAIRCSGKPAWTLYVGLISAVLNTALNYCFIFGNLGCPAMGVTGAAYASLISQIAAAILTAALFSRLYGRFPISFRLGKSGVRQYAAMLFPVVFNELFWALGQSVNTFVYGHMGTEELAGMSLTGSVQGLTIGALSGLSQAAGILIGRRLGEREYEKGYQESKKLCFYGLVGSLVISLLLVALRYPYVRLYRVSPEIQGIGADILIAFAVLMPVKVQNMILGGGIIRCGGKTRYIMIIDMIGTWLVDIPLALLTGLVWKWPIVQVYFTLSQEELLRMVITIFVFRRQKWMYTLE